MKYVVVLPDGVADVPIKALGDKTPLEVAKHPNMDWIAREGITGWSHTIPPRFAPGSDVGCMSVFGYDPRQYYTGRAPLEAAAQGIALKETDVAFRCNTVTVERGVMVDYSAGHIENADSTELIKSANERLRKNGVRFYAGVSYRHLAIVASDQWRVTSKELANAKCTPPHDISGKAIDSHLPTGPGSAMLRQLMQESVALLRDHPVNQRRVKDGKKPATMLWFWGQGTAAKFPPFQKEYGLRGACVSAVDIVRGLGRLVGFDIIQVPGITGYFDTNYKGKADYALRALDDHDFVLVHIEPTDEAGHMGDVQKKIQAIEDTDRLVVGTLLEGLKKRGEPFAILVVCDHPTSTILKTHIAEPVPFALYATNGPKDDVTSYNESAVNGSTKRFKEGFQLMSFFLQQGG
ncbi:MAG: cofactor-independent phosphoglycerate mutase [Candidatus Omnitrophica bacterium]|nr:cofactor-independent phosphoglycerate mutase [Candidatus Omnitrophota bacterium]MBI3022021.1 cofactor-independent phosphoglycerate mutase [Candidatus Omnitrophota bacterium]MBI3083358.1 cofactor-independent phosphoglycerate mutase [Candidatus Omnitrophota bacterium]